MFLDDHFYSIDILVPQISPNTVMSRVNLENHWARFSVWFEGFRKIEFDPWLKAKFNFEMKKVDSLFSKNIFRF